MRMENRELAGPAVLTPETAMFHRDVLRGLRHRPKTLPCKYLYDAEGSLLFERITELEEYYPTRTERQILERHIESISRWCGPDCLLVELGSGSSAKTRLLLDQLVRPAGYVPIDIAPDQLYQAAEALRLQYASLEILPVCADYHYPLQLPEPARRPRRRVIFFPGSTIGNLEPIAAAGFLTRMARQSEPGDGMLIGVDLQKPRPILERAYNDASGVTAAFNLNLLRRINRELDADFDLERFSHRAIYNQFHSRIEMHLVSLEPQAVRFAEAEILFAPDEHITTEHSYKYSLDGFSKLAEDAGFEVAAVWSDPQEWFAVFSLEIARR